MAASKTSADAFRVMYARLSVLRPFIVAEAKRCVSATAPDQDTPKSILNTHNTLYMDLCSMCVSTAHDTLEALFSQLSSPYRSSPWHTLYCKDRRAQLYITKSQALKRPN